MAASSSLYQEVLERIAAVTHGPGWSGPMIVRLALLVTGILAAQSSVLGRIAVALHGLRLTEARQAASIQRRLGRTLAAAVLGDAGGYRRVVRRAVDWAEVQKAGRLVLLLDESSQDDRLHLLRVSVAYRGGSLPVAWVLWEQNGLLPAGAYWAYLDRVLAAAATLVPAGVPVLLLADRAYDVPPLVDRLTALGWHWVIRCKAKGTLRYRDATGREQSLRAALGWRLRGPGWRWKGRGQVFKQAGWRTVSVVGQWAAGQQEPLVVLSDLPPRWELLWWYGRRFWIECGFRNDKGGGWDWEASRVSGVERQQALLLALAWASLVTVLLGVQQARAQVQALGQRGRRRCRTTGDWQPVGRPERVRHSLFTLGLHRLQAAFWQGWSGNLDWQLPDLTGRAWTDEWRTAQARRFLLLFAVPP